MILINSFLKLPWGRALCVSADSESSTTVLWDKLLNLERVEPDDHYIVCNGKLVSRDNLLQDGAVYHVIPRLSGGKGGFGSMLRAIGAQIEKTTSREACRDLSGRRMRDINNEKKLREWVGKQAEREKERQQQKQERLERRRALPKHNFDDPQYTQQKMQVAEELEDALQEGLHRAAVAGPSGVSSPSTGVNRKRKSRDPAGTGGKKAREWLGIGADDVSDIDSDSDAEGRISPGPSHDSAPESGHGSGSVTHPSDAEYQSDSGVESTNTKNEITEVIERMDIDTSSGPEDDRSTKQYSDEDTQKTPSDPMHTDIDNDKVREVEASSSDLSMMKHKTSHSNVSGEPKVKQHGLLTVLANSPAKTGQHSEQKAQPIPDLVESEDADLSLYGCVEQLEALGGERLKVALMARRLKCGGTTQERAQRLFSVKGLQRDQINSKLFAKPVKGKKK